MRSTGEVLGVGADIYEALYKGFMAAGMLLKGKKGIVLATIGDADKAEFIPIAKELGMLGYSFLATHGTAEVLKQAGLDVREIRKLKEKEPNILDEIKNLNVDILINTPTKGKDSKRDGFIIRRAAIEKNISVITVLDTIKALVEATKKHGSAADIAIYNMGRSL
jgi:carbamoyl-phosphate synthase large subunit